MPVLPNDEVTPFIYTVLRCSTQNTLASATLMTRMTQLTNPLPSSEIKQPRSSQSQEILAHSAECLTAGQQQEDHRAVPSIL